MKRGVIAASICAVVVAGAAWGLSRQVLGQTESSGSQSAGAVPRHPDGRPNLEGYWSIGPGVALSNQIEEHPEGYAISASRRVIDTPDGKIPYQPWALAERDRRRRPENSYEDPEGKCLPAGVPRQMWVVFQVFQILQPRDYVLILHEYVHAYRHIPLDGRPHLSSKIRLWEGDSVGRWEGDTLVVETTNLNGKTWLELSGDFISGDAHILERFTMRDRDTLDFEVTITDPKVFTQPWTIAFPYVRNTVDEMFENDCHEGNVGLIHTKNLYDAARRASGR